MPNIAENGIFWLLSPGRGKVTDLHFRFAATTANCRSATASVIFTTVRNLCIVTTNFELMYIINSPRSLDLSRHKYKSSDAFVYSWPTTGHAISTERQTMGIGQKANLNSAYIKLSHNHKKQTARPQCCLRVETVTDRRHSREWSDMFMTTRSWQLCLAAAG